MRRLRGTFGQRPVGDISSQDVERLRGELGRDLSSASANPRLTHGGPPRSFVPRARAALASMRLIRIERRGSASPRGSHTV